MSWSHRHRLRTSADWHRQALIRRFGYSICFLHPFVWLDAQMISSDDLTFASLSPNDIRSITHWRYVDEYSVYDMADESLSMSYMLDPANGFFGIYQAR